MDENLAIGDQVYVVRPVPVRGGGIVRLAPGDTGTVEAPGDNFVAIRVRGIRVTVPRDDLVPAPRPMRAPSPASPVP